MTPLCANDIYEGPLTVENNVHIVENCRDSHPNMMFLSICVDPLNIVGKCKMTYGISHRGTRKGDMRYVDIDIFVILGRVDINISVVWKGWKYT